MKMAVNSEADEKNSMSEWPDGVTKVACDTRWASRADGHLDGCPTEGGRAPDGEHDGCPTEGGSRGWPNGGSRGWLDGGVYKSCWPTFLGTLLQCPVSPVRNAGAQGANE
jgi:hypothetical protein